MAEVIVTKWEEFKEAVSVAENTVICPPEVWDLSDETISNLQINCKEIQGNGLTLKGLYITDTISKSGDIYDLNMPGIYAPFSNIFATSGVGKFVRCGFSGECNGDFATVEFYSGRELFEKCSFRFKANCIVSGGAVNVSFDDCDMLLNCTKQTAFSARNSRISGKLKGGLSMAYAPAFGVDYGHSVINAEIPAEAEISMRSELARQKILINKDLCVAPIPSELIPVTSSQLNDTGYLTSIGFLTGG
jgi:hypothetical protein